jgi:hypothetical protein
MFWLVTRVANPNHIAFRHQLSFAVGQDCVGREFGENISPIITLTNALQLGKTHEGTDDMLNVGEHNSKAFCSCVSGQDNPVSGGIM